MDAACEELGLDLDSLTNEDLDGIAEQHGVLLPTALEGDDVHDRLHKDPVNERIQRSGIDKPLDEAILDLKNQGRLLSASCKSASAFGTKGKGKGQQPSRCKNPAHIAGAVHVLAMLQRCVFVTQKEIETEYEKQFRTYMQGMQAWTGTHFQVGLTSCFF